MGTVASDGLHTVTLPKATVFKKTIYKTDVKKKRSNQKDKIIKIDLVHSHCVFSTQLRDFGSNKSLLYLSYQQKMYY